MTLTPRRSSARASALNRICLGTMTFLSLNAQDAEDVLFLHDEELLAVELHLAAGILAEDDPVAALDRGAHVPSVVGDPARAHGDDFALVGLLLGGVGNEDAAALGLARLDTPDEDAVVEWAQRGRERVSHGWVPPFIDIATVPLK